VNDKTKNIGILLKIAKSFSQFKNSKMEDILYRYNVCYLKGERNGSRV